MFKYNCLNPIAAVGLDLFSDQYEKVDELKDAQAALVRSAAMHDLELPDTLEAVARAGTGSLNFLIIGFCMGVCNGFAIPLAHKFGAGDYRGLRAFMVNAIYLSAIFAVVMTAVTVVFCRPILELMRTPDNIIDGAYLYIVIIFAAIYRQPAVHLHADWCVNRWGRVIVTLDAHKDMAMPPLPRLGIMLPVERSMRHVTYYGYGPDESYIDKREHCYVDMFQAEVEDLHENYIRPQENGSHYHCRYVSLENEKYRLLAEADNYLDFNVSDYTVEELAGKRHNFELEPASGSLLSLDARMMGIGSNSCGPDLQEEFLRDEAHTVWKVQLQIEEL